MNSTKYVIRFMNVVVLISFILILINIVHINSLSTIFNFQFSWVSIAYLISAVLEIGLLLLLKARLKKGDNLPIFWFMMYIFASIVFLLNSAFSTASATLVTYLFWQHLLVFDSYLLSAILLVFVIIYIGRRDLLYRPLTWTSVFGMAFFLGALSGNKAIISNAERAVRSSTGFPAIPPSSGLGSIGTSVWSVAVLFTAMLLLILYYRVVRSRESTRNQVRLLIFGVVIPILVGTTSVLIVPITGANFSVIPFLGVFEIIIIGYALVHYENFIVDPNAINNIILKTVNEAVMTISVNHEILFFNRAAQSLLNLPDKNIYGNDLKKFFDKDSANLIIQNLQYENTNISHEIKILVDNKKLPVSLIVSRIIINDRLEGYVLVIRNITKEQAIKHEIEHEIIVRTKELSDEHAKLQAAIDNLEVGLLMTFKGQDNISYNAKLPKIIFGKSHTKSDHEQISLKLLEEKLQKSNFNIVESITETQNTNKSFDAKEITYGNKILRIFGAPIRSESGDIIGTVILIDDITESKIQERSKDEFFSIASHELRTPLTSIKGNASMIMQYYPNVLKDASLKEMIEDIHTSSVRLIEVVNDFLDVSRLEQSKISFNFEAFNIEEIIEAVVYEMQAVIKEKNIYLKIEKLTLNNLPKVWADKNRLKQVVYNLIGNAVKFTEKGGITISAELFGKDSLKVLVSDTGPGMTESSQQLLFHKFQQASSSILTRDTTRGTGLGLYISKMILENMDGNIRLEKSVENVGTVFSFTIKLYKEKHENS